MKILALAVICSAQLAFAKQGFEVFNVPPLTENNAPEALSKKNVPQDTLVQMDSFAAMIPKGWSFLAAGVSEKMSASLTSTPSEDVEHDETFVGINERKAAPTVSLEDRAEKYKKEKKGWKIRFDDWRNAHWLIAEYSDVDKTTNVPMNHWAAFAISHGKEYWMLAAAPTSQTKKYAGLIAGIMRSVELRNAAAPPKTDTAARSQAPAPLQASSGGTNNDKRLRDDWRITSFKMDDGIGMWSEREAGALVGQHVIFSDSQMKIGSSSCLSEAVPVTDKDLEKNLLRDIGNPCGTTVPGGPVFQLNRKKCSRTTNFPPYMTFESKDDIIAFGDAISFCLRRQK